MMGTQANVRSVDALRDLRTALALYSEDVLAALGGVEMELKRTAYWVSHERRAYWQEQIKRRREAVAQAKAEVFRRKLAKTDDYTPAMSEQKELLRKTQVALLDAESRLVLLKKWEPALQQAVLEYHGGVRRLKDRAAGDVLRAVSLLERLIDALEAYLRLAPPSGATVTATADRSPFDAIAGSVLDSEPEEVEEEPEAGEPSDDDAPTPPEPEPLDMTDPSA